MRLFSGEVQGDEESRHGAALIRRVRHRTGISVCLNDRQHLLQHGNKGRGSPAMGRLWTLRGDEPGRGQL